MERYNGTLYRNITLGHYHGPLLPQPLPEWPKHLIFPSSLPVRVNSSSSKSQLMHVSHSENHCSKSTNFRDQMTVLLLNLLSHENRTTPEMITSLRKETIYFVELGNYSFLRKRGSSLISLFSACNFLRGRNNQKCLWHWYFAIENERNGLKIEAKTCTSVIRFILN